MKRITYFDVLSKASPRRLALMAEELNQLFAENLSRSPEAFDPSVKALVDYVKLPENKFLRIYIGNMLNEAPENPIKTPDDFFQQLDNTLHLYPKYNEKEFKDGLPFYKFLQFFMATGSGYSFFTNWDVQPYFAAILKVYHEILGKPASCKYLKYIEEPGYWFSKEAWKTLKMGDYIDYDPSKPTGGFTSWNEFFIRKFKNIDASRPIKPDPTGNRVISPVDGQVFKISEPVLREAAFEIKGEQYYLTDLLDEKADSPLLQPFVGGLAVQIVLMPVNYHRWHSPVTGEIKKVKQVPGYFFAQQTPKKDYAASFPFLSHCNARTIFFIEPRKPDMGRIALIFVGLTEVSSCVPTKKDGMAQRGDEIGQFEFGGSTCCILFEKGKIAERFIQEGDEVNLRQDIARAQ